MDLNKFTESANTLKSLSDQQFKKERTETIKTALSDGREMISTLKISRFQLALSFLCNAVIWSQIRILII